MPTRPTTGALPTAATPSPAPPVVAPSSGAREGRPFPTAVARVLLLRGVLLSVIGALFAAGALRHALGSLARPGPGLFPLLVSGLLLVVGLLVLARALLAPREGAGAAPRASVRDLRNIAVVTGALIAFVLVAKAVNGALAVVALVFIGALAGTTYSWRRNAILAAALVAIAFFFQEVLHLNLRLI